MLQRFYRKFFFIWIFFLFPINVYSAGPTIITNSKEAMFTVIDQSVTPAQNFDYVLPENADQYRVMRVQRKNRYYFVALVRQPRALRLFVVDDTGKRIADRRLFKKKKNQFFPSFSIDVVGAKKNTIHVRAMQMKANRTVRNFYSKTVFIRPDSQKQIIAVKKKKNSLVKPPVFGDNREKNALKLLNYYRKSSGVLPVQRVTELDTGCQKHAEYMRINETATHYEYPSAPGYTEDGADAGAASNLSSLYKDSSIEKAMRYWFEGVYHRLPMLNPNLRFIGMAMSRESDSGYFYGCFDVHSGVEFNGTSGFEDNVAYYIDVYDPVAFPGQGVAAIPATFSVNEEPNPLAGTGLSTPTGYMPSIQFPSQYTFTSITAQLQNASGSAVPFVLKYPNTPQDPNQYYQGNSIILVPKNVLQHAATYSVKYTVNSQIYEYTFTTQ